MYLHVPVSTCTCTYMYQNVIGMHGMYGMSTIIPQQNRLIETHNDLAAIHGTLRMYANVFVIVVVIVYMYIKDRNR